MSLRVDNSSLDERFSVAMCVYGKDNPQHFQEAVESIVNQSIKPDEIVLVVDGPVPNSLEKVIRRFEDGTKFKVIWLSENVGHGNARKKGVEECSNELIALMDADDISVPDRFEKQLACFARNDDINIVGGNIKEFIGTVDNVVGIREVPVHDVDIKRYMKKRCPFNQVTVMFKKSAVEAAGGYIDWPYEEDYYLWIRMYQNGAIFMNLDECLVYARVGKEMYRRRGGWKYFRSEAKLQKYMWTNGIIGFTQFFYNIGVRFVVQVLMPTNIRGFFFKKYARKQV